VSDGLFEKLVSNHSRDVLNAAFRIVGDASTAQDVHQDVFLEIWRRWGSFNGDINWGAYLYRMTIRKALEYTRRTRFVPINENCPPTTKDRPDAAMKADELRTRLTACLCRLPKKQADVFVLARIEGLSYEKIAEILGCSPQTARVHLHRALKRLARELGDYIEGPAEL
jgi:RNA polymerase sigma-70 factor, ECF subfamily